MKIINANLAQNSYDVYFIRSFDELIKTNIDLGIYNNVLVITDDIVAGLYLDSLLSVLQKITTANCKSYIIKNGEPSKNIKNAMDIVSFMADSGFHRNDLIIALGGGVVGDLSGFVASIFMRGIDFLQIPTTLLAAVDASIGGKTAIDIPLGKNLVGTFHQPKAVIEMASVMKELPKGLVREGVSEIIKYGAIYDRTILELLNCGIDNNLFEIIYKCVKAKIDIVSLDEKEKSLRKILNFGHTFAHALEQCSEYTISHGEAVAYGMEFECLISYRKGHCSKTFYDSILRIIADYYDLTSLRYPSKSLVRYMTTDKKNCDSKIVFAIPTEVGNTIISLNPDEVFVYLNEFLEQQ